MEEDFAFNHSPNTPLWDTIGQYHKVNFENLEEGKYYYYKHGNYIEDYIVQVTRKSNQKATFITKYKRTTSHWGVGPNAKYEEMDKQDFVYVPSEWKEADYVAEITLSPHELDDDQAPSGPRRLYVYDEDVVMQNGGVRKKTKHRTSRKISKTRKLQRGKKGIKNTRSGDRTHANLSRAP